MTEAIAHITGDRALRIVASHPAGKLKTSAELRDEADRFLEDAERRDRLIVGGLRSGNRRQARALARARFAEQQRANARLAHVAAAEVERRHCETVGDALRNPFIRLLRRLFPRVRHRPADR